MRRAIHLNKNLALYYAFPKIYVQRFFFFSATTTFLYFYDRKLHLLNILKNQDFDLNDENSHISHNIMPFQKFSNNKNLVLKSKENEDMNIEQTNFVTNENKLENECFECSKIEIRKILIQKSCDLVNKFKVESKIEENKELIEIIKNL
jgi:hypothetical protein